MNDAGVHMDEHVIAVLANEPDNAIEYRRGRERSMTTYTITERNGCRLVAGDIPLSAFGMLTQGMPRGAVIDTNAARMLGVNWQSGYRKFSTR